MSIDPFVARFPAGTFPDGAGPLSGLRLAVKDNLDIAGHVTGSGHPGWAAARQAATQTAPVVGMLAAAGARIAGKTHMDELAYSLMGENAHYGTPLNPAAPDRVPGGSSSGSASAVAQGLADLGIGTDTGGSVRLPASFCGLWGWRPTHGLLPAAGMQPLAASYDVPGLFARDAATLLRAAAVLAPASDLPAPRYLAPADLWAEVPAATAATLRPFLPAADAAPLFPSGTIETLQPVFRIAQGKEVAETFGAWIRAAAPEFGPGVRERFDGAMALSAAEIAAAEAARAAIRAHVRSVLGRDGVIVLPTAPGAAPRLGTAGAEMECYRNTAIRLLSIAGHAGLPQITMPLARIEEAPLGLSLIGPPGTDLALMALAAEAFAAAAAPA
ncbi:amidase [Poseidonocella sp. HB161398]|uniref:amidase n=1 Tax=Poseidonocella sp. HB161398 TaxID=2320855 RepID=UPI001109E53A|nr:amidase [Poseidonocella sp. HB161398]